MPSLDAAYRPPPLLIAAGGFLSHSPANGSSPIAFRPVLLRPVRRIFRTKSSMRRQPPIERVAQSQAGLSNSAIAAAAPLRQGAHWAE